ncbi:MAG TPA: DNA primase [Solirubrobacteraceae bacterium]|nr:DNA primase [Solirubrobacteraceae bacterium]
MALYTKESKDRVRDAVDFLALVSARTDLRRAGPARYEGLCPFHEERTPSFGIDPTQKVYYCFGCQASGDVFTFVQETEGVDFKGALELLAERSGIELELEQEDPREQERRRRRERLLELLGRTSAYYERYLWESQEAAGARSYLHERGLAEEMLREFRVGYAPSAWDRVLLASRRAGFTVEELYATGLAQRSRQNGQPYDRFRSRIMFPLADLRGRVLGFGARASGADQQPKYLNTSDNDLYHKGLHLYGADLARAHAARAGEVILCEGYTDTIALHQAGMRNAVGLMGTALTAEQVGELARMAQTVLLALDADTAGQEAMLRASSLASKRKLELRVVPLPAGTDPAELIAAQGAEAMRAVVDRSAPFVRFRVERVLASGDAETPEGRDRTIEELAPVFATLPASAMRLELTRVVADRLNLPESLVEQLVAADDRRGAPRGGRLAHAAGHRDALPSGGQAGRGERGGRMTDGERGKDPRGGASPSASGLSRREETERAFLALCIALPEQGAAALADLDIDEHFSSRLLRRVARHLRDGSLRAPMQPSGANGAPDVTPANGEGHGGAADGGAAVGGSGGAGVGGPGGADPEHDLELRSLLAELIVEAGGVEPHPAMLEVQRLQLELARLDRDIQRARGREEGDVSGLAVRRGQVKHDFDRAYAQILEETGAREA